MNIQEIRAKYPQYDNLSDEQLAHGLHKKYYSDMDYADFTQRIGLSPALQPMTDEQRKQAESLRNQFYPKTSGWDMAKEGLKGFGKGAVVGATRPLNGATLGATDWLDRNLLGGNINTFKHDINQSADNAGIGWLNKGSQLGLDFAGNITGAGGALVKGLGNAGLKGLKLASSAGGIEGAAYGLTGTDYLSDLFRNFVLGSIGGVVGGTLGHGVLFGLGKLKNPAKSGLKGGLTNIVSNSKAAKLMHKGLKFGSDDLRREFLNNAYSSARKINSETADMINNSLARRIDVPKTVSNQKAKYGRYLDEHAADEVLDFAPTKAQLKSYAPESSFNPNNYTKDEAEKVLRDRANNLNRSIFNDGLNGEAQGVNHFLGTDRRPFVRTLENTINRPDIKFNFDGKQHYSKKYNNTNNGNDFMDLVITKDGKIFNKFPSDEKFITNKIKGAQDLSLSTPSSDTFKPISGVPDINNIALQEVVVNPKLPNVSSLYDGLTPFQARTLDKAIKNGLSKTNQKAGSLESLNKIKQELNDAIVSSQSVNPNNRLLSIDSSDTVEIRKVKKLVDDIVGKGLKGQDRTYQRAKRLEAAYNQGRRYNPNGTGNDDLIPSLTPLENNAFAQGLFKKMTNNPLIGEDLAKSAMKYENVLSDVLPQNTYNNLISNLNNQSIRFGRLNRLGNLAESKLSLPDAEKVFLREQLENRGSLLGAGLDWGYGKLRGKALERAARKLLDPTYVGALPVQINPAPSVWLTSQVLNNFFKNNNQQ